MFYSVLDFSQLCHSMEKKKYNLCSFKSDAVQAPIQMHLSEDHDFLTNLLGSDLVNSSDSDDVGTQPRSFDRLASEGPSTSANKHTTSDANNDDLCYY